ncbi:penicillin acylase family protein [Micromonospora sp. NPDC049048]|uniref:penicillin acylase family protein n=1 Tax=Micromonospora sp. NPDC049048 TaxID=3364263 RepID=UPI00371B284C
MTEQSAALRELIRRRAVLAEARKKSADSATRPVGRSADGATGRAAARPLTGRLQLPGFAAPVEISTDAAGVPHVSAASRADLYRAQGFLHHTERRWQIDVNGRVAAGELAALLGPAGIASDLLAHRLGLPDLLDAATARAPEDVRQVFAWYAEGARCAASAVPDTDEHRALGRQPAPPDGPAALRTATALFLLFGLGLQQDWLFDLLRATLNGAAGPLWSAPPGAADEPPPAPGDLLTAAVERFGALLSTGGAGSNAWAVGTPRGAAAGPVLAADPHLAQYAPGHWMPMHLTCPDVDVIGASLPGVPDLVFGYNGNVAWATTFAPVRTSTLTLERLVDGAALRPDGTEPVRWTEHTVEVAGAEAVTIRTGATSRGRLLGLDLGVGAGRYDLALDCPAWADPYDQRALAGANTAVSGAALAAALTGWHGVPQSIVYADRGGRIGTVQVGTRAGDTGAGPHGGWATAGAPQGVHRHRVDSGEDLVVAANHAPPGGDEAGHWEAPVRADRIGQLLRAGRGTSVPESARAQLDVLSPLARELLPELVRTAAPLVPAEQQPLLTGLAGWSGQMYRDLVEPTLFVAWLRQLTLDMAAGAGAVAAGLFVERKAWMTEWGLGLLRDRLAALPRQQDGPTLVAAAFDRALTDLRTRFGPDPARWTWGRQHTVVFSHHLSGFPGWTDEPIALALPGSDDTVCRGDGGTVPRGGPTFRMIVDLARPDDSVWAFPVGVSGVPASPHHRDLCSAWSVGRYHRMLYRRGALQATRPDTLTLLPVGADAATGGAATTDSSSSHKGD